MRRPCEGGDGRTERARRRFYASWRAAGAPSTTPQANVLYIAVVLSSDTPVSVPDELRQADRRDGNRWESRSGGGCR